MATGPSDDQFEKAASTALRQFPVLADELALVTISENVTFRVRVKDSKSSYVLRLHRPGYCTLEELESERVWTAALQASGLPVPGAVMTLDGLYYTRVDIPGTNEQRYAGLTTWQDGVPLIEYLPAHQDPNERSDIFHRIGEIVALFHKQSSHWTPSAGFTRRRLGADELLGDDPYWGRFWEHPALSANEQTLLLQTRDDLRSVVDDFGEQSDSFSLIHADLTPENIIYDGENLAVIDFDDAAWGWHVYDLASILVECRNEPDLDALRQALLTGYSEHRKLAQRDLEILPVFSLIRGMAMIGWYLQRPEHAGDPELDDIIKWVLQAG